MADREPSRHTDPSEFQRAPSLGPLNYPVEMREFAFLSAESSYPVLLHGETGCGKTYLARQIHQFSPRSSRPFIHVNCAAVPEGLFEREMFGHVRGAFTDARESSAGFFEVADGGTLFLDEFGELPRSLQPKLLRVLEEGRIRRLGSTRDISVNARLIMATNRDLEAMVSRGEFREDLFYRCSVLEYRIPPLRERRHSLVGLVDVLLRSSMPPDAEPPRVDREALDKILHYSWPGNIRELENALRLALMRARGADIEAHHLPERVRTGRALTGGGGDSPVRKRSRYVQPESSQQEVDRIREALSAESGNRTRTARRLGMARSTLWAKLRYYGILSDHQNGENDDASQGKMEKRGIPAGHLRSDRIPFDGSFER